MPLKDYAKQIEYNKEYRRKHREKARIWSRRNYQKNKGTTKKYWRSPIGKFNHSIAAAKDRNLMWKITFDNYSRLINCPCYYCGKSVLKTSGVSLDRINNSKGYKLNNVVTACGPCNRSRSDYFTMDEFKVMITALLDYRKGKWGK